MIMESENAIDNESAFLGVRIPSELKEKIDLFAKENDITASQMVRKGLKMFMEKENN